MAYKKITLLITALFLLHGITLATPLNQNVFDGQENIPLDDNCKDSKSQTQVNNTSQDYLALVAHSGCCSWHSGVCGCTNGRAQCCDGTLSPSCGCD